MSKHHLQNLAEQMASKGHGCAPFHYGKSPDQVFQLKETGNMGTKIAIDNNSIQLRAYQIHEVKGGSEMDNWLEAERILRIDGQTASNFINEGNPNTQK